MSRRPSTRIATGEWARGHERQLLNAVQAALEEGIKIPDWDRDIVVDIYNDNLRVSPPNRTSKYTRIEIGLYAGRSLDSKRALYRAIVRNLAGLGVEANDLKTILLEFPLDNCAPHGAEAACDIQDLGYAVKV